MCLVLEPSHVFLQHARSTDVNLSHELMDLSAGACVVGDKNTHGSFANFITSVLKPASLSYSVRTLLFVYEHFSVAKTGSGRSYRNT